MKTENARILLLSHRNVANKILARCLWFEFEDIIEQIDTVCTLTPGRSRNLAAFDRGYRVAAIAGKHFPVALNPGVQEMTVRGKYDLFFTACAFPTDLLYVNALRGWRQSCEIAICWIDEMLISDLTYLRYFEKLIAKFDHVIVSCSQAIDAIQSLIPGDCIFVPPGVDALKFCPFPDSPERFIDVLSIGRRPEKLHDRLIRALEGKRLMYSYDTISFRGCKYGLTVEDPKQHRLLTSNLLQRSKCFVTYPGKFDDPTFLRTEEVIGARFFEGAAAGALMIGQAPRHELFETYFPWPNAVTHLDLDAEDLEEQVLEQLGGPERERQRREGVGHSLLCHDWASRWEAVLKLAGLGGVQGLFDRRQRLEGLASMV